MRGLPKKSSQRSINERAPHPAKCKGMLRSSFDSPLPPQLFLVQYTKDLLPRISTPFDLPCPELNYFKDNTKSQLTGGNSRHIIFYLQKTWPLKAIRNILTWILRYISSSLEIASKRAIMFHGFTTSCSIVFVRYFNMMWQLHRPQLIMCAREIKASLYPQKDFMIFRSLCSSFLWV